jgi:hypothetical protein
MNKAIEKATANNEIEFTAAAKDGMPEIPGSTIKVPFSKLESLTKVIPCSN